MPFPPAQCKPHSLMSSQGHTMPLPHLAFCLSTSSSMPDIPEAGNQPHTQGHLSVHREPTTRLSLAGPLGMDTLAIGWPCRQQPLPSWPSSRKQWPEGWGWWKGAGGQQLHNEAVIASGGCPRSECPKWCTAMGPLSCSHFSLLVVLLVTVCIKAAHHLRHPATMLICSQDTKVHTPNWS